MEGGKKKERKKEEKTLFTPSSSSLERRERKARCHFPRLCHSQLPRSLSSFSSSSWLAPPSLSRRGHLDFPNKRTGHSSQSNGTYSLFGRRKVNLQLVYARKKLSCFNVSCLLSFSPSRPFLHKSPPPFLTLIYGKRTEKGEGKACFCKEKKIKKLLPLSSGETFSFFLSLREKGLLFSYHQHRDL